MDIGSQNTGEKSRRRKGQERISAGRQTGKTATDPQPVGDHQGLSSHRSNGGKDQESGSPGHQRKPRIIANRDGHKVGLGQNA